MVYRQYEEPRTLEEQLNKAKERLEQLREEVNNGNADEDELIDAQMDIEELKERVNFAWQDEEYEDNCRRESEFYGEGW